MLPVLVMSAVTGAQFLIYFGIANVNVLITLFLFYIKAGYSYKDPCFLKQSKTL